MVYIIDVKITPEKINSVETTIKKELNDKFPSITKIKIDTILSRGMIVEIETDEKIDTNSVEDTIKNSLKHGFLDVNVKTILSYTSE
ncbi:MAG: hypothetical protein KAW45_09475 [Thermoplasmatales archaeon]|nr:hypothetical protein [Thermoplasmatales archaeon]